MRCDRAQRPAGNHPNRRPHPPPRPALAGSRRVSHARCQRLRAAGGVRVGAAGGWLRAVGSAVPGRDRRAWPRAASARGGRRCSLGCLLRVAGATATRQRQGVSDCASPGPLHPLSHTLKSIGGLECLQKPYPQVRPEGSRDARDRGAHRGVWERQHDSEHDQGGSEQQFVEHVAGSTGTSSMNMAGSSAGLGHEHERQRRDDGQRHQAGRRPSRWPRRSGKG